MNKPDVLRVTNDQNPAIADAMRGKKIGDAVTFQKVKATLKSFDAEGYDFIIEAVIPEGYEEVQDAEPNQMAPMPHSEAIMTPTAMTVQPKA